MRRRAAHGVAACIVAALLTGCASAPPTAGPADPLEPMNRSIYAFNRTFDHYVFEPVARGYRTVTPGVVDQAVTNFFDNIGDISVLFNSLLQLKGRKAAATTMRLVFNTTIGLYGLIDVASVLGIDKQHEDFGQTLGYWGVPRGPYLVLPLLGPSTLRDGTGHIADAQYDPTWQWDSKTQYGAILLNGIDTRADLLGTTDILETAAVDPYAYTRNAWLQRRAMMVHDGNPPVSTLPGPAEQTDDGFNPFSDEDDDLFEEPAE